MRVDFGQLLQVVAVLDGRAGQEGRLALRRNRLLLQRVLVEAAHLTMEEFNL